MSNNVRIRKLAQRLEQLQCDLLIIDSPTDLFYLTGASVSLGRLVVSAMDTRLFVDSRYFEACCKVSPVTVENSQQDAWLHFAKGIKNSSKIGFDSRYTSYANFKKLESDLSNTNLTLCPIEDLLAPQREVKDAEERKALQEVSELGASGFDFAQTLLTVGISEKEVATEIEIFWKKKGCEKPAFDINVSFGENSAIPHHRAGSRTLKEGDIALFDIGTVYNHYCSDMTRVVFFRKADSQLKEIYEIVKTAQETALTYCKAGATLSELDTVSREVIAKAGYGENYTHSLGHGIGLEVHETPFFRKDNTEKSLEEGMALTIEPGIYLPGKGGVRIEDTVLILEGGYKNLTNRSKELKII